MWCVAAIGITLALPDLSNGIRGVTLYVPNWIEVGVSLGIAFILVVIDEEMGGDKLIKNVSVFKRKRKHAIMVGFGISGILSKLFGSVS